jgi:hypothetical protein
MTRLAFCFMTNNYNMFFKLYKNFNFKCNNSVNSFTKNVLFNPPIVANNNLWDDWNVRWKSYYTEKYTDYFSIRQDSLAMADNSELIFIGDDDFIFQEGSIKIIHECAEYMIKNADCGAIYLGAYFGDEYKKHGEEIYIANDGHLGTNRGIMLRNRKRELLDNRLHALGANEDFVIGFTCLLQGYYICRRLNVPIKHVRERNTLTEGNQYINYDTKYLREHGIMSKINTYIGEWTNQNIWPKNIFIEYCTAAQINGFFPKYRENGEIIC